MLKPHSDIKQQLDMIPRTLLARGALDSPPSLSFFSHSLPFCLCECEQMLGGVSTATFCGEKSS